MENSLKFKIRITYHIVASNISNIFNFLLIFFNKSIIYYYIVINIIIANISIAKPILNIEIV